MEENQQNCMPKGAFIPFHILFDPDLSPREKLIWADINSTDVCWKSLSTLAEQHGIAKENVSRVLTKLRQKGYIELVANDGRHKEWRALMDAPKSCRKCFFRNDENVNSITDKKTGVGDKRHEKELNKSRRGDSETSRMTPETLNQKLKLVFKVRSTTRKKERVQAVEKLQNEYTDQEILESAKKFAISETKNINGNEWKPDYLWMTDPNKTDKVVPAIERAIYKDETRVERGVGSDGEW